MTITHDHDARRRSYELIAEAFGLAGAMRAASRLSARLTGDALEHLGVDVEVRVHRVDVVVVLERVDEPQELARRPRRAGRGSWLRATSADSISIPASVERRAHGGEVARLGR